MIYTEEQIERAAIAAHEMNRLYCAFIQDQPQQPWELALDWQKTSAKIGV